MTGPTPQTPIPVDKLTLRGLPLRMENRHYFKTLYEALVKAQEQHNHNSFALGKPLVSLAASV